MILQMAKRIANIRCSIRNGNEVDAWAENERSIKNER